MSGLTLAGSGQAQQPIAIKFSHVAAALAKLCDPANTLGLSGAEAGNFFLTFPAALA